MAIAPAFLRQKLFRLCPPTLRCVFSTGPGCLEEKKYNYRFIPDDCRVFFKPSGRLWTTAENSAFLSKHNINHDNGIMKMPRMTRKTQAIFRKFRIAVHFHPRHTISHTDLKCLDPRGHPLAASQRMKWARMTKEQPLWITTHAKGGGKRVVRLRAMRRVRHALYTALEERGYDKYGNGKDRCFKGTLHIVSYDTVATVSSPSHELGPPLIELLEMVTAENQRKEHRARAEAVSTEASLGSFRPSGP